VEFKLVKSRKRNEMSAVVRAPCIPKDQQRLYEGATSIQLAFLVDATGSMSPYLRAVGLPSFLCLHCLIDFPILAISFKSIRLSVRI